MISRPSWDEYWLAIAKVAATRSHDSNTKHGCVIVKDNRPLGMGYNGYAWGLDDGILPTNRPADESHKAWWDSKYPWMIHSEVNALANCIIRPQDAIAYITGPPCFQCVLQMHQQGVIEVRHGNLVAKMVDEKQEEIKKRFLSMTKFKITQIEE